MSKGSRGGARLAAGKKKTKRRVEPQPIAQVPRSTATPEPVQPKVDGSGQDSGGTVLRFRPRAKEAAVARPAAGRGARTVLEAVDYGYVYADLRVIGGLSAALFGGLVALSLVLR
ncbi:MAG: hypothetical protein ACM3US_02375 [Sphingomonadaceae bacterium]